MAWPWIGKTKYSVTESIARAVAVLLDDHELIPAHVVFPDLADPVKRPANKLAAGRYRADLTQAQLAKLIGISRRDLSAMEKGKRPIGKKLARILSKHLKLDYRLFI